MQSNSEQQPQPEQRSRIRCVNLDEARPYNANMSVSALMEKWLEYKQGFVKESTYLLALSLHQNIKGRCHVPASLLQGKAEH